VIRRGTRAALGCLRLIAGQGQRRLQPGPALAQVAAQVPEPPERRGQRQERRGVLLARPAQRRAQVLVLDLQAREPRALCRPGQPRRHLLGQRQAPGQVPVPHRRGIPAARQVRAGIFAHRLQQPIAARLLAGLVHLHQRLVHQRVQPIQHRQGHRPRPSVEHRLRGGQRPAPHEGRQPAQQQTLRLLEQVPAPVQRRAQGALACGQVSRPARKQSEAVVQPGGDHLHRQAAHPRRRQLDGQRDTVQPHA
jgi:hypothetical protein